MNESDWLEYERWIIRRLHFRKRGFKKLFISLHNIPFIWDDRFPRDEDRALDGLSLRRDFLDEYAPGEMFSKDCSVLEMLAAFAIRIDNEYTGIPGEPRPEVMFERMLKNMGLLFEEDYRFNERRVRNKVNSWLLRDYPPNGENTISPVKRPRRDHRTIDIWSQMMEYVTEYMEEYL